MAILLAERIGWVAAVAREIRAGAPVEEVRGGSNGVGTK
jgi:hypothetical protein